MSCSPSLDNSINILNAFNKVLQGAYHASDLEIKTLNNGQKALILKFYAKIPFFGRIISFIRHKLYDASQNKNEIAAIKQSHDASLNVLLEDLLGGKDSEDLEKIKKIYRYHSQFHFFKQRSSDICSDPKTVHLTFKEDLSARCSKLCQEAGLEKMREKSDAGKTIEALRLEKIISLKDTLDKISSATNETLHVQGYETLTKQQLELTLIESKLKNFSFLKNSPNKFFELCQRAEASETIKFEKGHVGPLSDTELSNLLNIIQTLKQQNKFNKLKTLTKLEQALSQELDKRTIEIKLAQFEYLADATDKLSVLKERLKICLAEVKTRILFEKSLCDNDIESLSIILDELLAKNQLDKTTVENFKAIVTAEKRCEQITFIYAALVNHLCSQLEQMAKDKDKDLMIPHVCQKLNDMHQDVKQCAESGNDIDDAFLYLTKQRNLLCIALSPLNPAVIKRLKLSCVSAYIFDTPQPEVFSLDEKQCLCEIHKGLTFSVALSVYFSIKKMEPESVNWDRLPDGSKSDEFIVALAKFDMMRAIDILEIMPSDTNIQKKRQKKAYMAFTRAYEAAYKQESQPFSRITPASKRDLFIYNILRFLPYDKAEMLVDKISGLEMQEKATALLQELKT